MRYCKIIKNFLSEEECNILNQWILDNNKKYFFKDANMGGKRITTRYSENIPFPKEAFSIKERLIKKLELSEIKHPPFCEGMVASYAEIGDNLYLHKDPIWQDDLKTLHCNVVLSNSEGGFPIIEDKNLDIKKGDLWCYLVSEVLHGSSSVIGKIPRTMWVFGFLIDINTYNKIF